MEAGVCALCYSSESCGKSKTNPKNSWQLAKSAIVVHHWFTSPFYFYFLLHCCFCFPLFEEIEILVGADLLRSSAKDLAKHARLQSISREHTPGNER